MGGAIVFSGNATLQVPGFTQTPIIVEASSNDVVQVQIVEYVNPSAVPAQIPTTLPPYRLYLDFHVEEPTPGATNYLIITINLSAEPVIVDPDVTQILWWNGTHWTPFSNFTVDAENATITVYIDQTTSPSISDLSGTPIILATLPSTIGGQLALGGSSSFTHYVLLVALLTLAAIQLVRRK